MRDTFRAEPGSKPDRVVAGETGIAELRLALVAGHLADGLVHAVDRDEGEAVYADLGGNLVDGHACRDQLVLAWRVDPIEAGVGGWRAGWR